MKPPRNERHFNVSVAGAIFTKERVSNFGILPPLFKIKQLSNMPNNQGEVMVFIVDDHQHARTEFKIETRPEMVSFSIADYSGYREIHFAPNQAIEIYAFLQKYFTQQNQPA